MKKFLILAAAVCALAANAQQPVEHTNFGDNWSIGVTGGVTTPLVNHPFFGDMRGQFGLDLRKQVSPIFGLGVEGQAAVNTSSWRFRNGNPDLPVGIPGYRHSTTAIDNMYVGAYGAINLTNLFCGFSCEPRVFALEAVAGAGWGHMFRNNWIGGNEQPGGTSLDGDYNYFATKAGLNFNFNLTPAVTLSLRPAIVWNMTGSDINPLDIDQTNVGYNVKEATFDFNVGLIYNFGKGFPCVTTAPDMSAEVAALNARINELRGQAEGAAALAAAEAAKARALAAELEACRNQPKPEVQTQTINNLNSVRYVFFKIGSSVITPDQMPNVEMIAQYLKNHPNAKVQIRGYASKDGPEELNIRLAKARAESVKNSLINKYKVAADRIDAQGEGIGNMFTEESWNRVSICTIED